jgi:hypothetical protein
MNTFRFSKNKQTISNAYDFGRPNIRWKKSRRPFLSRNYPLKPKTTGKKSACIAEILKMNEQQIEGKAASLAFAIERGTGCDAAHYFMKDCDGKIVGKGSLKKMDLLLDDHIKKKVAALGLRLSAKKVAGSFDDMSTGEVRAAQREMTTGYKLERKEVIADKGRAGEDRKQREDRAVHGGQNVEWITVLGPDHTATWSEVIEYLNNYANDVGLDSTDVDSGAALPMTEFAASNPIKRTLSDAEFNEAIENHANANQIKATRGVKPRPGRDEQRRQQAIDDFLSLMNSPVRWDRLSPEEKRRLYENYKKLKDEDERANDAKHHVKKKQPTWADLERLEEQRRERAFRKGDLLLKRTNIRSGFDWKIDDHNMALINGQDPGKARQEMIRSGIKDWQSFTPPEKNTPDFSTPQAIATPQVVAKKRRVPKADLPKLRTLAALAKVISDTDDRAIKGTALIEAKATLDAHGGWLDWLAKETSLNAKTAQRLMAEAKPTEAA